MAQEQRQLRNCSGEWRLFAYVLLQALIGLNVSPAAQAETFRERGDELIEASVMEADVIIDAVRAVGEGARIVNVLYGKTALALDVAAGAYVQIDGTPSLTEPTYSSPGTDATIVIPALSERYLEKNIVRLLLFQQTNVVQGIRRYGAEVGPSMKLPSPSGKAYSPRILLGRHAYTWLSFFDREENTRGGWTDERWQTKAMVEDLTGISVASDRSALDPISQEVSGAWMNLHHPLRYFSVGEDMADWKKVLDRVQRSIGVKTQIQQISEIARPEQQLSFYLALIRDEKVYANYAIEILQAKGDREIAAALLGLQPNLKFYVDDVQRAILRLSTRRSEEQIRDGLSKLLSAVKDLSENVCADQSLRTRTLDTILTKNISVVEDLALGFLPLSPTIDVLAALYEAELDCYLRERSLSRAQLVPRDLSTAAILALPQNRGLTRDERGILEYDREDSPQAYRARQKPLESFQPVIFNRILQTLAKTSSGLRGLLNYCGHGLLHYPDIAFPDRTRGVTAVWSRACGVIDRYEWPQDYCEAPDSRTRRDSIDIRDLLTKAIFVAIERGDEKLFEWALNLFYKPATYERSRTAAWLVRRTFDLRDRPLRADFLASLTKLPFFPVAQALAEEFSKVGIREAKTISRTLEQLTGAPAAREENSRDWVTYLSQLSGGTPLSENTKPLFTRSALMASLTRPPCDKVEYGWNRLFRLTALPQQ